MLDYTRLLESIIENLDVNSPAIPTIKFEQEDENVIDEEWLQLILEAKRLGLTVDELRQYFKEVATDASRNETQHDLSDGER